MAVVLLVVLLVFGAKRLPEMGRSLGHGLREFKDSVSGDHDDNVPPITRPHADEVGATTRGSDTDAVRLVGADERAEALQRASR